MYTQTIEIHGQVRISEAVMEKIARICAISRAEILDPLGESIEQYTCEVIPVALPSGASNSLVFVEPNDVDYASWREQLIQQWKDLLMWDSEVALEVFDLEVVTKTGNTYEVLIPA